MSRGSVSFTNSHGNTIYVAYMRRDWGCLNLCGDRWDVQGWINLAPGETETRTNPTENRWFYYYAEAEDGSVWSGDYLAEVTDSVFQKCMCIGVSVSHGTNPWYDVGMDVVDLDEWSGVEFT